MGVFSNVASKVKDNFSGDTRQKVGNSFGVVSNLAMSAAGRTPVFNKDGSSKMENGLEKSKEEPTSSDENLKDYSFCNGDQDLIEAFSRINAIDFKYNDKAHSLYGNEEHGVDNDEHVGVKAQELEANPVTSSSVVTDENGYKMVDTKELTLNLAAVVSELCKRVSELERNNTNKL